MKTQILLLAAVLISLGAGIVIGRKTSSPDESSASQHTDHSKSGEYRSARLGSGGSGSGSSRHGSRGSAKGSNNSASHKNIANKVNYMTRMAEKLNMQQGMPDFDAMFGIWEIAGGMSPEEIQLSLKEMKSLQLPQQSQVFMKAMLVMQWAKKDGASAMAYANSQQSNRRSFPIKQMALQAWGSNDPAGAYRWYESNKETLKPRERKRFEAHAIAALARENFNKAFAEAKKVNSASRKEVLQGLASVIANKPEQRQQFLKHIHSLDDEEARNEAGGTIARQMAAEDVQQAIQFVQDWPGEDKSDMAEVVARQWGQEQPAQAIKWQLSQLPDNTDPSRAVDDIFADWARRTPDEAKVWLVQQEGLNKDTLINKAADRMRWDEDFERSATWVSQISDAKLRNRKYKRVYSSWTRSDKEGAQRWLETQPDELQQAIKNSSE